MRYRTFLIAVATLVLLCVAAGQSDKLQEASVTAGSARVTEVKGKATIRTPDGNAKPASAGQVLVSETTIETAKGSVLLILQDGSQVLVKPKSRVVLKSPIEGRRTFFELFIGKVLNRIEKRLENAPSFKMGTPSAVITVRGTRFEVEVTKANKTIVDVYEGLVDVAGSGFESRPVMLRPGFETQVEPDHVPTEPREMQKREEDDKEGDRRFRPGMVRGMGSSSGRREDDEHGSRPRNETGVPSPETESSHENDFD